VIEDSKMTLQKLLDELTESWEVVKGVPDRSGPEEAGKGRGMGNCPKRKEFDSDEEYEKALKVWKKKQK